jgi:metal-responsive CopG/Arc/MetJ family transcriptional regulator
MNTLKVAISMPPYLLKSIDNIRKKRGLSRSKYISSLLREIISAEENKEIRKAYDTVFSEDKIKKEQLETSRFYDGAGSSKGEEW